MSDYWIGDWVKIYSTGKKGKFEGEVNNKAKIKVENKLLLVDLSDIELLTEDEIPTMPIKSKKDKLKPKESKYTNTIDLHIEKLAPAMQNEIPELIVSYQIKKAKEFLLKSIERKQLNATVIHGIGTGALKMEVEALLKSFDEVYFTKSANNGGAIEILFRYY